MYVDILCINIGQPAFTQSQRSRVSLPLMSLSYEYATNSDCHRANVTLKCTVTAFLSSITDTCSLTMT